MLLFNCAGSPRVSKPRGIVRQPPRQRQRCTPAQECDEGVETEAVIVMVASWRDALTGEDRRCPSSSDNFNGTDNDRGLKSGFGRKLSQCKCARDRQGVRQRRSSRTALRPNVRSVRGQRRQRNTGWAAFRRYKQANWELSCQSVLTISTYPDLRKINKGIGQKPGMEQATHGIGCCPFVSGLITPGVGPGRFGSGGPRSRAHFANRGGHRIGQFSSVPRYSRTHPLLTQHACRLVAHRLQQFGSFIAGRALCARLRGGPFDPGGDGTRAFRRGIVIVQSEPALNARKPGIRLRRSRCWHG